MREVAVAPGNVPGRTGHDRRPPGRKEILPPMTTTFADLGVPAEIVSALARQSITEPFPIQAASIADGLAGRDLCGKAATGSGKTIAFGVPMVARVTRSAPKKPKGLVLAPTRELAIQVADELRALTDDLRVLAVYGGAGIEPQIKKLRSGVDIVVATPGRLIDLMDRDVCRLGHVTVAVVDEADRMADMGFLPDVRRILDQTPDSRQTVLFSATLDGAIDGLVQRYQHDPVVHEVAEDTSGTTTHHLWECDRQGRVALVADIVDRLGPTVVFSRTKHGADRIARQLGNRGVKAAAIHGNRSQGQRERALEAFHRGDIDALVATDVAARGIHVEGVLGVVHYDLPGDPKDYVHRSGRTGRAGSDGTVVALFDASQRKDAQTIARKVDLDVDLGRPDVAALPEGPQQAFRPAKARKAAASPGDAGGRPSGGGKRPSGAARRKAKRANQGGSSPSGRGGAPKPGGSRGRPSHKGGAPRGGGKSQPRGKGRPGGKAGSGRGGRPSGARASRG